MRGGGKGRRSFFTSFSFLPHHHMQRGEEEGKWPKTAIIAISFFPSIFFQGKKGKEEGKKEGKEEDSYTYYDPKLRLILRSF